MTDFDSIYDALKAAVDALGGAKKVGPKLRPEAGDARGWLLNCLNPEHSQKLDPEHVALILRMAGDAGFHVAKHWIDNSTGYAPTPPIALQAQLAEALASAQESRRRAEESERDLRSLIDNPKLMALANAMHLKVEEL